MTRAEDVHAIEQLLRTYARLNDAARWQEVAELFTEDARFVRPSDPDHPLVGRAAILQSFLGRPAGGVRQHLVANPEVERIDDHHARARCHSVLLVQQGEEAGTVTVGGFVDRLTRTANGWRFAARTGFTTFDPVPYRTRRPTPTIAAATTATTTPGGIGASGASSFTATPGHPVQQPQS